MLRLRLQRLGKTKHPSYRLVVSEKIRDPQGRSLEILGIYNPVAKPKVIQFKSERVAYWLSKGAKPSPTVHNLLVNAGLITGKKQKSVYLTTKRKEKLAKKKSAA